MSEISYWKAKLERIQYALRCVRALKNGRDIDDLVLQLEDEERRACADLVDAEKVDGR